MIRAIFLDVDGTLLSPGSGKVPQSTKDALACVRARGIKTFIATGRHLSELSKLPVMQLAFDGYLTLNGQLILDSELHVIAGKPIDRREMEIVTGIFEAKRIPFVMIGERARYINYVDEVVVQTQRKTHGSVPGIGSYGGEEIYQCLAFVPEEKKRMLDALLDECSVTSWNETGIDIIPKGGGKAHGIELYLKHSGIDADEIMAFGDGENDIDMLKLAGVGVAMGNASEIVKSAADYVTDDVDHDGIANALRHFGLIT